MRTRFRLLARAVLIALMTAAPALVASPASATTPLFSQRIVTESVWLTGMQHRHAFPMCAPDEVVTGGGFHVDANTDLGAYTVYINQPMNNGWNVQMYFDPVGETAKLTAYAICLKKLVGAPLTTRTVSLRFDAPGNTTTTINPQCAKDEYATGGGHRVMSINTTAYKVYASEPMGNGWGVKIISHHQPDVESWGYVVCLKIPDDVPVSYRVAMGFGQALGPGMAGAVSHCDYRTELVAGGGFVVSNLTTHAYAMVGSEPAPIAWTTVIFNRGGPVSSIPIRSVAVCLGNTLP